MLGADDRLSVTRTSKRGGQIPGPRHDRNVRRSLHDHLREAVPCADHGAPAAQPQLCMRNVGVIKPSASGIPSRTKTTAGAAPKRRIARARSIENVSAPPGRSRGSARHGAVASQLDAQLDPASADASSRPRGKPNRGPLRALRAARPTCRRQDRLRSTSTRLTSRWCPRKRDAPHRSTHRME